MLSRTAIPLSHIADQELDLWRWVAYPAHPGERLFALLETDAAHVQIFDAKGAKCERPALATSLGRLSPEVDCVVEGVFSRGTYYIDSVASTEAVFSGYKNTPYAKCLADLRRLARTSVPGIEFIRPLPLISPSVRSLQQLADKVGPIVVRCVDLPAIQGLSKRMLVVEPTRCTA